MSTFDGVDVAGDNPEPARIVPQHTSPPNDVSSTGFRGLARSTELKPSPTERPAPRVVSGDKKRLATGHIEEVVADCTMFGTAAHAKEDDLRALMARCEWCRCLRSR